MINRRTVKTLIVFFAFAAALAFGFLKFRDSHYLVPVLMYHSISDPAVSDDTPAVSEQAFRRQMRFLKERKYRVISLNEFISELQNGIKPAFNTVVLTFDDGYKDNLVKAYPVLKEYSLPATIFVLPGFCGKENFLDWQEIRTLSQDPFIDIGSHGLDHAYLPAIEDERKIKTQIEYSKELIESRLDSRVTVFCYPVGGFNHRIKHLVEAAGYKAAVATKPGFFYPDNDMFALKRIRITERDKNLFIFWVKLTGLYTPIREAQRREKDRGLGYGPQ